MPIPPEHICAINHCVANAIPFVAYNMPGEGVRFFADTGDADTRQDEEFFEINRWNTPSSLNCRIYNRANAFEVLAVSGDGNGKSPQLPEPTDRDEYLQRVNWLVGILRGRGGKTVVSRTLTGKIDAPDWGEIVSRVFDCYPDAFCNIYYHPEVGFWLGATPEVLLRVKGNVRFNTMALAGTHRLGDEWDSKNLEEQKMVADFISEILTPYVAMMISYGPKSLRYGDIEHLCTRFTGAFRNGISTIEVIDKLSPTPAVAGLPRDVALSEIEQIEQHRRGCYAGYLAVHDDVSDKLTAYVNLRCLQFLPDGSYCIYAGGGITAESDPAAEWCETEAKAASLLKILEN